MRGGVREGCKAKGQRNARLASSSMFRLELSGDGVLEAPGRLWLRLRRLRRGLTRGSSHLLRHSLDFRGFVFCFWRDMAGSTKCARAGNPLMFLLVSWFGLFEVKGRFALLWVFFGQRAIHIGSRCLSRPMSSRCWSHMSRSRWHCGFMLVSILAISKMGSQIETAWQYGRPACGLGLDAPSRTCLGCVSLRPMFLD